MPIYEFRCRDCGKKSTFLTLSVGSAFDPKCGKCGSRNLDKLVSRVAVYRSEESRLESLADPSKLAGLDENDPKSLARWMKKMGKELGEDFGGEDLEQLAEEAAEEVAAGKGEESDEYSSEDL